MDEGPFSYANGTIPNMSVEEIWSHLREADPRAFFELSTYFSEEDKANKYKVLAWIREHYIFLFETLENILRSFQTAYHAACEARVAYLKGYHLYKLAREAQLQEGKDLDFEMRDAVVRMEEREVRAKTRKRRAGAMPEDLASEEVKAARSIADLVKTPMSEPAPLYYAEEPFTEDFPLPEFRHYVKKGSRRYKIEEIANWGAWEHVYHCNGPWNAELLSEELKDEGHQALVIKKIRGADAEVMGYRVLTGKFNPLD